MIKWLSLMSVFSAQLALAAPASELIKSVLEQQPDCQNFVRFDDENLYLGTNSSSDQTRLRVAPFDGREAFDLTTKANPIDVVTEGKTAWVLTPFAIEEWNLEQKQLLGRYKSHLSKEMLPYDQAAGLARYDNKLIIAHRRLGVTFFDLNSRKVTNQFQVIQRQLPRESLAQGVVVEGRYAYVLVDNLHPGIRGSGKNPFRGLVVVDMVSERVVAELDGIDAGSSSLASDGDRLIVSFGGLPIWKYSFASIKREYGMHHPMLRMWKYPYNGHPVGIASMDAQNYYTCFLHFPERGQTQTGSQIRITPMALNRQAQRLD